MNIVLIGMRGAGKTTIGKILAERLSMPFIELDDLIVKKAGFSIPEITAYYGWDKFRDIESEITVEAAKQNNAVIATGGGIVVRENNIQILKKNEVLIWLTAGVDSLHKRIGGDNSRPPLTTGKSETEEMEFIYNERKELYQKAADYIVSTENKIPEEVVNEIVRLLVDKNASPITGKTKVCCVIGNPVEHSLSPLLHNTAYGILGLDFVYVPFKATNAKQAVDGIRGLGIRGASVTIPYKQEILNLLDDADYTANTIGAVNTIINENGRLTGYNTDWTAAVKTLEEAVPINGKKVVLIGAGGAAAAIAFGLKRHDLFLTILNRTADKAGALAKQTVADSYGGMDKLETIADADILINATSVGMFPNINESIVPEKLLHKGLTVFDIVYNPKETKLLADAKAHGCGVIYGYKMLLYQAAIQFELFTSCPAPLPVMEEALIKALGD